MEVHGPSGSIMYVCRNLLITDLFVILLFMVWPKHGFCLLVRINGTAHAPHIAARADESLDICSQVVSKSSFLFNFFLILISQDSIVVDRNRRRVAREKASLVSGRPIHELLRSLSNGQRLCERGQCISLDGRLMIASSGAAMISEFALTAFATSKTDFLLLIKGKL